MVLWANVVWNIALTDPVMVDGMFGGSGWFDVGRGSRVHNPPVAEDLVPVRTTRSRSVMITDLLVNIAEQPWSHSWPMERIELDFSEGNMCAKRAEAEMLGIWSKPVCVLEMVAPSGRVAAMLSAVTAMASRVLDVLKKNACGSGVDNIGGVCRRGGGRLCGCNTTSRNC
jgi:hypothetical protein